MAMSSYSMSFSKGWSLQGAHYRIIDAHFRHNAGAFFRTTARIEVFLEQIMQAPVAFPIKKAGILNCG